MKLYRFYQVSGFIEVEAASEQHAKDLAYNSERGTHNPIMISTAMGKAGERTNKAFVYVSALGNPVEINPATGAEINSTFPALTLVEKK
jgi:hypothetical protein